MKWRPDKYERLVFHVESRGDTGHWHRVDLEADLFRGECSCEDFKFRKKPLRKKGGRGECVHIKVALVAFARTTLDAVRRQVKKARGTDQADVGPT